MRRPDCAAVAEQLDEFALDILPGDTRADVITHIGRCEPCRRRAAELSAAVDTLLALHPGAAPEATLCARVLAEINVDDPRAQRSRHHRPLAAFVLGLVAAIIAFVSVSSVEHGSSPSTAAVGTFRTAALESMSGQSVGEVTISDGNTPWILMRVDNLASDGDDDAYRCVLDLEGGAKLVMGSVELTGGRGVWGNVASLHGRRVVMARLVGANGDTIALARFV